MKNFKFLSDKVWSRYKKIVGDFLDNDAGRQKIIWASYIDQMLPFGEDSKPSYDIRAIEALCYYNAFRNWPINSETTSGELDEENLSIIISSQYLRDHGYLNDRGYLDFNWSSDRFIINGIVYKPSGDTQIAQAKDEALAFLIILKRDIDTLIDIEPNIVNQVRDTNHSPIYTSPKNRDIHHVVITT